MFGPHKTWIPVEGRILLIEDDELFAESLKKKIERSNIACDWVKDAKNAKEALGRTTYHTALIDIFLGSEKPEGLELIQIATQAGIPSIIITSQLDLMIAKQGMNNGADYVLEKDFELTQLLKVLHEIWENPKGLIARRERFFEVHGLTEKEKELTRLLIKGLSNQEIADVIGSTLATVKFYTNQIFEKCEVKGRAELFNCIFPT